MLEQSNRIGKETVSISCHKPLPGKYLEIVASTTRVKVFEIQHFGKYKIRMKNFPVAQLR
jgi:hypothetical protein